MGAALGRDAFLVEADLDRAPIARVRGPFQVACGVDRFQIVEHRGEGKPPADRQALSSLHGSYRADDGRVFVIARLGWFLDVSIGPAFAITLPKYADLIFEADFLTIRSARSAVGAHRVKYRETDVTIPADSAGLAGAITEPLGAGPHPGIVIIQSRGNARRPR